MVIVFCLFACCCSFQRCNHFLYFLLVNQERTEKPLAVVDNKKLCSSSMKHLTKWMQERTTGRSNEKTEQKNGKQNKVCAKELVIEPRSN